MIKALITSQTRIKLLKKFFLNSSIKAHLRGLESEFGDSTNAIRIELNRFEKAGLLLSSHKSNKKLYQANREHPLFDDIHNIIIKETGINTIIEKVITSCGDLDCVYLTGEFAHGKECQKIELILVGNKFEHRYLNRKIKQAEEIIGRTISYVLLRPEEAKTELKKYDDSDLLPLWHCNEN